MPFRIVKNKIIEVNNMKYTLEWLKEKHINEEKLKYLFFWGHRRKSDYNVDKSCLSQWFPCEFKVDGIKYSSAEQYMMAEKAKLFGDTEVENKILKSNEPNKIKGLGRKVKNFQEEIWDSKRIEIVKKGNYEKFSQNKKLGMFLKNTNPQIIVEASPLDIIWGIGMDINNSQITNPLMWRGQNLLGFILTEVRDELDI